MELYILTSLMDYNPSSTVGVFSSLKLMEAALKLHKESYLVDGYEIEIVTLNKVED